MSVPSAIITYPYNPKEKMTDMYDVFNDEFETREENK